MVLIPDVFTLTIILLIIIVLAYALIIRPWIMRMGTTAEERVMALPGDDLVNNPNEHYTQAVTIKAPAEIVWAYLVQVGYRRAGWYNWDYFNRLSGKDYFYENNKSAKRIIPELQNLKTGDKIYLTPQIGMKAEILNKPKVMVLTGREKDRCLVAWLYYLQKVDSGTTRLIVHWNSRLGEGPAFALMNRLVVEPGGMGIQQTWMLRGIKKRCEAETLHYR